MIWVGVVLGLASTAPPPPSVEELLHGNLTAAAQELQRRVERASADDTSRFGLGVAQFLVSLETLGRSLHRHGLDSEPGRRWGIPILRFPVPSSANPELLSYEGFRAILVAWQADLERASATLEKVRDDRVQLSLGLEKLRLDLDGDGRSAENESLLALYARYNARVAGTPAFTIGFDAADVHWLRGYCQLLLALTDIVLAHDPQEQFDHTAQLFFARAGTTSEWLTRDRESEIADLVAWVHLFHWRLREPARMNSALVHLRAMVAESRETWSRISAETDDDHEWIPNPRQTPSTPGAAVTPEMVAEWQSFLADLDGLLAGRKLLGHWRVPADRGINLSRAFTEPRDFDPVLWIQGSAAAPYVEVGEVLDKRTWARLQRVFQGEFIGFFIWVN